MEKVASSTSDMVFMGDFNLNVLNSGPDLRKVAQISDLLYLTICHNTYKSNSDLIHEYWFVVFKYRW